MGRKSETGGVRPAGDRIEIRFTWQGKELRPTLALKPNAANLAHARRLRERQILPEIAAGTLDLARHFPDYKFRDKHQLANAEGARNFRQWAETWALLAARTLEHSSLSVYKRHLAAYWTSVWGDVLPERITHEMVLKRLAHLATDHLNEEAGKLEKGLGRKTQNNIMIPLRGLFERPARPRMRRIPPRASATSACSGRRLIPSRRRRLRSSSPTSRATRAPTWPTTSSSPSSPAYGRASRWTCVGRGLTCARTPSSSARRA
jgi:integrase